MGNQREKKCKHIFAIILYGSFLPWYLHNYPHLSRAVGTEIVNEWKIHQRRYILLKQQPNCWYWIVFAVLHFYTSFSEGPSSGWKEKNSKLIRTIHSNLSKINLTECSPILLNLVLSNPKNQAIHLIQITIFFSEKLFLKTRY